MKVDMEYKEIEKQQTDTSPNEYKLTIRIIGHHQEVDKAKTEIWNLLKSI